MCDNTSLQFITYQIPHNTRSMINCQPYVPAYKRGPHPLCRRWIIKYFEYLDPKLATHSDNIKRIENQLNIEKYHGKTGGNSNSKKID